MKPEKSLFTAIKCDTLFLRLTNVLLLPIFGLVLNSLNTFLYGAEPTIRTLSLLSYPMLLFFGCFYYTDNISLLVVLCYLLLQIREVKVRFFFYKCSRLLKQSFQKVCENLIIVKGPISLITLFSCF